MKAKLKFRFTILRVKIISLWLRISRYKVLEFDLEDWDDKQEFLRCTKAFNMCSALWDMDQWLRQEIKYPNEKTTEDKIDALQEARDKLYEILEDTGINLDEIY